MNVEGVDSNNDVFPFKVDVDDDDIAKDQRVQIVICLNYVWDAGNSKWVRMTQP